jgi:MFS family permease
MTTSVLDPIRRASGGRVLTPATEGDRYPSPASPRTRSSHRVGFWLAALAFLLNMGLSAVPTPLYPLYQQRDGISDLMVTVVYAVYAIGVVASLFLGGHLSDTLGRRRVFIPAMLINVLSALVFIFDPSLAGLIIARVVSGVSVGLTTATATSYLTELHAKHRPDAGTRRADVVATASNLGGIGFGPIVAGLLAQVGPMPLRLSYIVFAGAISLLALALVLSPETVSRPEQRPRYRPQRIAVPAHARGLFFAATFAGAASFAVFGVFNSLVPSFLAGTLHIDSHLTAGAAAFAPFAAAAVAQIFQASTPSLVLLRRSIPTIIVGLLLFAGGMWDSSLPLFLVGGLVTGAGAGMVFKGALVVTVSSASPETRAEVLAGFFLGAYIGLSIPVIGLGVATSVWAAKDVMLVFAALVVAALAISVSSVLRRAAV